MSVPGPSARLRRAAQAERGGIARAIGRLQARRVRLLAELAALDDEMCALTEADKQLQAIAPQASESPRPTAGDNGSSPAHQLGGRELRVRAVRELLRARGPDEPTHYRAWLQLLEQAGCTASGVDPGATLLANLCRSPVVAATGQPGTYVVDPTRRDDLQTRLGSEKARLERLLREAAVTVDGRKRRDALVRVIRRLETQLAESNEALATADHLEPIGR
jgi:hypothetical protein